MNENAMLALLESREAEANAKAEWSSAWAEQQRGPLLAGLLDTNVATLLAEVNADQAAQLNQALYLLMVAGDKFPLITLIQQLMDEALDDLATTAWSNHVAALHDGMNAEQWDQYQLNHQRTAA